MTEKRKPSYWELLRDPRWQRMRLEVMEREGFACQYCKRNTETLNVHHTFYEKGCAPWEYSPRSLMVLCENCHQYWHDRRAVLDGALAAISADPDLLDHVIGYARAIACEINAAQEPRADYMELGAAGEDIGIADRYGLTVGEVRAACRNEADDLCLGVSTSDLQKLDPRRSRV